MSVRASEPAACSIPQVVRMSIYATTRQKSSTA